MKKIRALTSFPVVLGGMTVPNDPPTEIWNEEVLESDVFKKLLAEKKMEILPDIPTTHD